MPSPRVGWVHVGPRKRSKSKLNLRGLGIEPDPPRPCGTIILILPFLRVDIYTVPVDLVDHVLSARKVSGSVVSNIRSMSLFERAVPRA
jgi:hypothetical protein